MSRDIPDNVAHFIGEHIDSVFRLEILLLLARSGELLSAEEVARELRLDPYGAADELEAMAARELIEAHAGEPPRYRLGAANAEIHRAVADLAVMYAQRPTTIITTIYSKPSEKLKSFADAFKLRKN